jgi:hypothetical protein
VAAPIYHGGRDYDPFKFDVACMGNIRGSVSSVSRLFFTCAVANGFLGHYLSADSSRFLARIQVVFDIGLTCTMI